MEETKELITTDDIRSKVYIIRGQQVMLDKDLAEIYGYEVKKLNQQVKRNIERFPEDFMFRLSNSEIDSVRSQIVTSRKKDFFAGQEGGRRYLPYAFTEQRKISILSMQRVKCCLPFFPHWHRTRADSFQRTAHGESAEGLRQGSKK